MITFPDEVYSRRLQDSCSSEPISIDSKRILWVDWMKSLGMYLIVLGHFFSWGAEFVYVFNVPLFFWISGFLSKKSTTNKQHLKKIFYNLFVPMLLITAINHIWRCFQCGFSRFQFQDIISFVWGVIIGDWNTLSEMWFVYTLIILKLLYLIVSDNRQLVVLMVILLPLTLISKNVPQFSSPNAIINVGLAFPFFLLGVLLKPHIGYLNTYNNKIVFGVTMFLCMLVIWYCGRHNGYVGMYKCGYGNNIYMFLIGGIAGIIWMFCFAKIISFKSNIVYTISVGSILILGLHKRFIAYAHVVYQDSYIMDYVLSAVILILFVPIIIFSERCFPLIIGKDRSILR